MPVGLALEGSRHKRSQELSHRGADKGAPAAELDAFPAVRREPACPCRVSTLREEVPAPPAAEVSREDLGT